MAYTLDQLVQAWTSVHDGIGPDKAATATLQTFVNLNGLISDAQAMSYIVNSADNTTALAALSYQFFTGKSPTAAGLDYLVNSPTNANDLNDAYYAKFGLENRYINFAANLGVQGEGAAAFATKYGALSFADYVASIYQTIIGADSARASGIDPAKAIADIVGRQAAILATAQSSGMITPGMTQAQIDLALKAAAAGYLLGEAIKADVGVYASAANAFMVAVATGTATYGADLTTTYAQPAGQSAGGSVVPPTFSFPTPVVTPAAPDAPAAVSHAFVLTTGTDTFTGESLSDTFTATLATTGSTLNAGDTLNGGGGDDTLSINVAVGSFTMSTASVSNIEHLRVTSTGAPFILNLAGLTGVTELVDDSSTRKVTFNNIGAVAKMAIANIVSTQFTATFAYAAGALSGNADIADLTLTNVTGPLPVKISLVTGAANEFETMTITSNGASNAIVLTTDGSQTSLTRLNVSGAAPLTLTFSASDSAAATITTLDTHAATGGVTIGSVTTALSAASHTITLGTGHNLVYLAAGLTAADTVTATLGTDDTLVLGASVTSANLAHVTGVETFRFGGLNAIVQDVAQLPNSVNVELGSNDLTLQHLANNATIGVLGGGTLTMVLNADTGTDALTVKMAGGTLGTLSDVTGLETLNIVANGAATITTDNVTAKHVVTGAGSLTLVNTLATHDIDASALTGNLTISLGTGADTVKGGSGDDTIQLLRVPSTPHNSNGGGDTITTGAGADIVVFSDNQGAGNGGATSYADTPTITDFSLASDRLGLVASTTVFQLTPTGGGAVTGLAAGNALHNPNALGGVNMVVQTLGGADGAVGATSEVSFVKLSQAAHLISDIKHVFIDAIGSSSITGLAGNGNYVVSAYDDASHQMLVAIVNVGGSANNDNTLSGADFVDAGVALIGVVDMSPTDYANFGATQAWFSGLQ